MQIDNLQPKFAAYNGATVQGSVPLSGDTVLIGEFAPGNGVFSSSTVRSKPQVLKRPHRWWNVSLVLYPALTLQCGGQCRARCDARRAWASMSTVLTSDNKHADYHKRRTLSGPAIEQMAQRLLCARAKPWASLNVPPLPIFPLLPMKRKGRGN